MPEDIAPALWARIERLIQSGRASDPVIRALEKNKKPTYRDAHRMAQRQGENTSRALSAVLKPDALPDGRMYYNIAERTVRPALIDTYESVSAFCRDVQNYLNETAGLGIEAIIPALNDDRIVGIIDRLCEAERFEDIDWILKDPVINFSQNVATDSVKANAALHKKAGLSPKVTRVLGGDGCEWCRALAGEYDYDDAPPDVWKQHLKCACYLFTTDKNGTVRRVWG